ncbi:hypothetical protein HIM_01522 [Hirsutella minnesotensis 3608]|nr:hypothetical protein HIM_01522 [Hirsutella minnesotensis 3608]
MGSHNLPSPPAEDTKSPPHRKSTSSASHKSVKPANRISKRANSTASVIHHHDHIAHGVGMDGRHKRVWKACERCRMKKTKCDGEFPCKRCKDDGVVCTAGVRKKVEYKQLPKGYAEVLENTQFALIATVHKLYSMVRSQQRWDLGEPELNDRGQPVIHNIAQKLGCIRPNSDIDLPVHSVFPEDEAGMAELARQLEEQQRHQQPRHQPTPMSIMSEGVKSSPASSTSSKRQSRVERASSSELDHSDSDFDYRPLPHDYRGAAFGAPAGLTMSPQSFGGARTRGSTSTDFDFSPTSTAAPDLFGPIPPAQQQQQQQQHQQQSPPPPQPMLVGAGGFPAWGMPAKPQQPDELTLQLLQQSGMASMEMLNQALLESSFGTIKPDILSRSGADVMMGMGDPMMCSPYIESEIPDGML